MKRPMTLTAGILGVVATSCLIFVSFCGIISFLDSLLGNNIVPEQRMSQGGIIFLLVYSLVVLGLSICGLILNILTIRCWKKSKEEYKKQKGNLIASIIFNFLIAGVGFIYSLAFGDFLFVIAAAVLVIIDLALENKRKNKINDTVEDVVENKDQPITSLEIKLERLDNMKSAGIITEEEYQELKNSYIRQEINK